jgi:hypothetical protein
MMGLSSSEYNKSNLDSENSVQWLVLEANSKIFGNLRQKLMKNLLTMEKR